jgi:hypothetical protein
MPKQVQPSTVWTLESLHALFVGMIEEQRCYFERLHELSDARWAAAREDEARATAARFANYQTQREDDRRSTEVAAAATLDATRSHIDSRKQWQNGHIEIHRVEKYAVDRASEQLDRRLQAMNQFREQLREQALQFVSRAEFSAALAAMERTANTDHDRLADMVPRSEMNLQFDTVKSQLNVLQRSITETTQLLATVRSRDAGRSSGNAEAIEAADRAAEASARNRSLILIALGVAVAVLSLLAGLFIGLRNHTSTAPSSPPTTSAGIYATAPTTASYQ